MILGRATHALLLWRLEHGEHVGLLDQLASSTSLTSTVISQFQLRVVSFLGLALVYIWLLSPVGGQASIRLMGIGTKIVRHPTTFDYMIYNGNGYAFNAGYKIHFVGFLNSIFDGAIVVPTVMQSAPRDLWGNVKIPRIEHYDQTAAADQDRWYNTRNGDASTYTSFVGIPVSGMNSSRFIDYGTRIHTPYLDVTCSLDTTSNSLNFTTGKPSNADDVKGPQTFTANGGGGTIITEPSREDENEDELKPFAFKFATYFLSWNFDYTLDCNITGSYVETEIVCPESLTYAINRARRSRLAQCPPNWTFIDANWLNLQMLFGKFLQSSSATLRDATLVQRYLSNPM